MRPIDADIVQQMIDKAEKLFESKECYEEHRQKYFNCKCLRYFIDKFPTLDVEPVRHGRWVKAHGMMPPEYHGRKCCSACDAFAPRDLQGREQLSIYCPNCGAKMDLE